MNLKKGTITVPPGEPEAVQHIRFVIKDIVSYHFFLAFINFLVEKLVIVEI